MNEGTSGREIFIDVKFSLYLRLDSYRETIIHEIIIVTLHNSPLASVHEIQSILLINYKSFPFYSTSGLIYGIHFAFQGESKTVTQLSLVHSRQLDRPCLSVRVACDNVTKFISSVYVHWDNNVALGPVPHHNGSVHPKGWKVDNPPPFLGIVSVTWSAKKCTQPIGMSVHLTPLGFPVLWITLHCVFKSFLFQWTTSHRIFPHLKKAA